jgi:hypothetical protein
MRKRAPSFPKFSDREMPRKQLYSHGTVTEQRYIEQQPGFTLH